MSAHTSPSRKQTRNFSGTSSESTHSRNEFRSATQTGMWTASPSTTTVCTTSATHAGRVASAVLARLATSIALPPPPGPSLQVNELIDIEQRLAEPNQGQPGIALAVPREEPPRRGPVRRVRL